MVRLHGRASLAIAASLTVAVFASSAVPAMSAECKRKTAGFYLLDASLPGNLPVSFPPQSIPVSLTGAIGDPERGRQLLVSKQKGDCLSCHKLSTIAPAADQGGIGAPLDGIASRLSEAQLRQVLVEPKAYFPDTMMPSYYKAAADGEAPILTAAEVEDLVAYLKTLK
jgi:sulfur-oxidizing protein SoxX